MTLIPLIDVPESIETKLADLGAPPAAKNIEVYRALAYKPTILSAWIDFAWAVRLDCTTPRLLRELMIVRMATLSDCSFELYHHHRMLREAGATPEQVDALASWRSSDVFTAQERSALEYAEASVTNSITPELMAELAKHFSDEERVELVVTAGLYAMVPRVIASFGIEPPEATA